MSGRFTISAATVVMLVLLRLNIGWHFFSEGVKHYTDPHWTSEPVLRNAKGPLAPWYRAYLPDFHSFEELVHEERAKEEAHVVQAWLDEIQTDWGKYQNRFDEHYKLDEAQRKQAKRILEEYQAKLRNWATGGKEALVTHVHEWRRAQETREAPTGTLPYQKQRVAEKHASLQAEASGYLAEIRGLEREFHNALKSVLQGEQREASQLKSPMTSIDLVDDVMTYVILGVGLLLILGLFTRAACVVGAVFLLSVVMMQPFWVSETQPTFNQYVEMFALLTLATTAVGRWAGLDFFVHRFLSGSRAAAKGTSDVSAS